jgi:hypothetical protein
VKKSILLVTVVGILISINACDRNATHLGGAHSSLDYMAPAAFAAKCLEQGSGTLRLPQDKEIKCEILSK